MSVPQLRFSGFEGEWAKYELGDLIVKNELGTNSLGSESNSGYPLIKMGNILRGKVDFSKLEYINQVENVDNKQYLLQEGDFLFNTRNTLELVGKSTIWTRVKGNYIFNSNIMRISFSDNLSPYFMNYYFLTEKSWSSLKRISSGTTSVAAIYYKHLVKVPIKIPTLKEQQKISSFITLLDKKMEKQKEKVEKLEQVKNGMIQKIFSQELRFKDENGGEFSEWGTKSLMELGEFKRSYSFSRSYEGEGKYFHIHYGDIHTKLNSIIDTGTELPNINVNEVLEELEVGDLLFADASEDYKDLGKAVVIINNENKRIVAGLHTHRFRPSTLINPVYLMYFTKTNYYSAFIRMFGTGVSVLGISKNNLGTLEVPVPSKEEQMKIADFLMNIDRKIKKEKEKLIVLEEQKKGFMRWMFV